MSEQTNTAIQEAAETHVDKVWMGVLHHENKDFKDYCRYFTDGATLYAEQLEEARKEIAFLRQVPPVDVDQDIEKHIGQTIYEINQRNSKVIGYLSTTHPQPSSQQEIRDLTKEQRIKVADWLCENPKCSIIDAVKYGMALSATPSRTDSDAVEFGEFLRVGFIVDEIDDEFRWRKVVTNDMQDSDSRYTTAELYSIFLTNKTKKQ